MRPAMPTAYHRRVEAGVQASAQAGVTVVVHAHGTADGLSAADIASGAATA